MMRKHSISAVFGVLLILHCIAASNPSVKQEEYVHIDYISNLSQEACFICGNGSEHPVPSYWGKDNVGIVHLNTFKTMYIEINRYGDNNILIEEPAGYMQTSHLLGENTYAHACVFPDNGYAQVQITGVQYAIDRALIQSRLCQTCLDSINDLWYTDQPPAEYAIVSFSERTIQPLLNSHPWFAAGNFGIDCEFKDNGAIDLLIHYCPFRY